MKHLHRLGFSKSPVPVKGTTPQSHGHWLHVWILSDAQKAKDALDKMRDTILGSPTGLGRRLSNMIDDEAISAEQDRQMNLL